MNYHKSMRERILISIYKFKQYSSKVQILFPAQHKTENAMAEATALRVDVVVVI